MSSGASPFTATDAVVAAIVINALVVLSTGKRGLHASSSGERQSLLGSSVATSTSHGHAGPAPLSRAASFTLALSVLCQAAAALFSFLSPTVSTGFVASACIVASSGLFVAMRVLISSESSVSTFAELSFALVSATYHLLFLLSATTNYPASVLVAHMGALGLLLTVVGISLCQGFTLQAEIIENQNEQLKKNGAALPSPEPLKFRFDNLFSILFFTWQSPLMRLGSSRPLTMEDLPELSEPEKAHVAVAKYAAYKLRYKGSLLRPILASEARGFFTQFVFSVCSTSLGLSGPYFLYKITGYIQNSAGQPLAYAFFYALCFGGSSILRALFNNHAWHIGRKMSMRIKAVLVNEIYCKSLRRIPAVGGSSAANPAATPDEGSKDTAEKKTDSKSSDGKEDEDASVGKIVTLMSTDAETIRDNLPEMYDLVLMPLQCIAAIAGLLNVVGWPALAGLAVMILTLPATYANSLWNIRVYEKLLAAQDARTTVVNEVLQGIRIIKYFAWEQKFLDKIDAAREKEMRTLIESYLNGAVNTFIWLMTPLIVSFVTLVTLTKFAGQEMDAQMAFTCLSLFNNLRVPLMVIPYIISDIFRLRVAFDRLHKFLNQDELEKFSSNTLRNAQESSSGTANNDAPVIGFKVGWFQWHTAGTTARVVIEDAADERTALLADNAARNPSGNESATSFTLRELNISFPVGALTAICGSTGAGKSSLLQALLGEMKRISGDAYLPSNGGNAVSDSSSTDVTLLNGSVAYVAQTSWLQNATIRANIIFNEEYDPARYDKVIKACALVKDLETLEAGDLTEIGEKGINLSGGQKQRVSLARALYSRASYILLDDPLSAVDAPTARHLFEKAICGPLMRNRTRILVTHATSLVLKSKHTQFLVAIQSGTVLAAGPVADAIQRPGVAAIVGFSDLQELKSQASSSSLASSTTSFEEASENDDDEGEAYSLADDEQSPVKIMDYSNGKSASSAMLIDAESMSTGAIKGVYYKNYLQNAGGIIFILLMFLINCSDRGIMIFNDYWIKVWSEAYEHTNSTQSFAWYISSSKSIVPDFESPALLSGGKLFWNNLFQAKSGSHSTMYSTASMKPVDVDYYIGIYAAISGAWIVAFLTAFAVRSFGSYRSSKIFHNRLIARIIYAPMRFFDTTPIGRILNRATKDISVIDNDVMRTFDELMGTVIDALAVLIVVASITPIFLVALVPILFIYMSVSKRFLACQREIKRIDSTTRSPIYSMFSETLVGVSTIRAYNAEERFMAENLRRVDTNHRAFFYMWNSNRWFGVRVSTIAGVVILCSALGTVAMSDIIGPGLAGLSLTWVLNFSDYLVWIVRIHAGLEMNMNAVERVCEYSEIEQERSAIIESNRAPVDWPSAGGLIVSNLEMRYGSDQPAVLQDVSFSVKGGEKVGIVGRTGAGKSSLSLSLFWIVPPSKGSITIDGIDISTLGLRDIRSRITMVPQDPVLFAGTIRSNLDPFSEYDDASLWSCLKQVRFMESMQSLKGSGKDERKLSKSHSASTLNESDEATVISESDRTGVSLDSAVTENGGNFSQGQRQLLCLARALLKSSRLTVFDEATASVDVETDWAIQQAIRGPSFAKTTVLSIAHRLRTVADYDKILVLDKGRVIQFGSPEELMLQEGTFRQMCLDSGEFEVLLEMARKGLSSE